MSQVRHLKSLVGRFYSIFILLWLLILFIKQPLNAQESNPRIEIQAELHDDHTIIVRQKIELVNTSTSIRKSVYLHGWINGYSEKGTALTKTLLEERKKALYFAKPEERGFFQLIETNSQSHLVDHVEILKDSTEILRIHLKENIYPNDAISLQLHYRVKIPSNKFTGYGFDQDKALLKYWYFIPAVFEHNRWVLQTNRGIDDLHVEPTDYTVRFSVPQGYSLESNLDQSRVSNNTYTFYGKKRKPFVIGLSKKREHKYDRIQENGIRFVFDDHPNDSLTIEITQAHLDAITGFLKTSLDSIPVSKIFLTDFLRKTQDFYGIQDIDLDILNRRITLFSDEFKWELNLLKQITHEVLDQSLFLDRRKDHWVYEGIKSYLMMKYLNEFHPKKQIIGNAKEFKLLGIRPIKNLHLTNLKLIDRYRLAYIYLARDNFDQPIKTSLDSMANINFIVMSGFKSGLGLQYLNNYLGGQKIDLAIKSFFQKNQLKRSQASYFEKEIKRTTTNDLDWFFTDFLNSKKKIDYRIKKYRKEKNHLLVTIKNKTGFATPINLTGIKKDSVITSKWIEGFKGEKNVEFPLYDYDRLAINDDFIVPELNERDNYLEAKGFFKNSKRVELKIIPDIENPEYNQIFVVPEFEYNNYDKFQIGLGFHNRAILNSPFKFKVKPKFSTGPVKLTGNGTFSYNFNPEKGVFQKITLGLRAQHKHHDRDLSFVTLSPSIDFNLKKKYLRSDRNDRLRFQYIFVDKESDPELPPDVEDFIRYSVFNAQYIYDNPKLLDNLRFNVDFQLAGRFGKIITDWRYQKYTDWHRQIGIRFFAGLQYFNNAETNYFDFGVDRINDYLFDSELLGQSEDSGIFFQQFVLRDGGFKSNFNQRANQWIMSTNLDIQIWKIFGLYADAGVYKNRGSRERFIYDSGIKVRLIPDFLEFYFPIQSSLGFELSLNDYQKRIRFIATLNFQKVIRYIRRGLY